ncbi:MAG: tRNA 2-thiouridine(34) synthase MnmA [Candidatus Omnitrophica bacterium]|nr:tRNA 2-thiouridine(34) synthase MnmA [Candidatus Omnitrophota bacterium]
MRVAVAMSGGVDSSVAAFILKEKGYDLSAFTIKTWRCDSKKESDRANEAEETKICCGPEALEHARNTAQLLKIPHRVVDLSKEFSEKIEKYFIDEYLSGRTPNPCVYCNSRIKFGDCLNNLRAEGVSKIATGHYARIFSCDGNFYLAQGKDKKYDQSYFLCDLSKETFPFIEFPLAELTKSEVRKIAKENGLLSVERKSSQDICFASGGAGYGEYMASHVKRDAFTPGKVINKNGEILGKHKGVAFYTVGQRRGLGIAGENAAYILKIDAKNNVIILGEKKDALKTVIHLTGFRWLTTKEELEGRKFLVKIRYNSAGSEGVIEDLSADKCVVRFKKPQFAPAPGQAAVFYEDETVAGVGWIC